MGPAASSIPDLIGAELVERVGVGGAEGTGAEGGTEVEAIMAVDHLKTQDTLMR